VGAGGESETYGKLTGGANFQITSGLTLQVAGGTTFGKDGGDDSHARALRSASASEESKGPRRASAPAGPR
jgi:hypothetical protein